MANESNPREARKPAQQFSPLLGLPMDEPEVERETANAAVSNEDEPSDRLPLGVIIPARNEAANLPACLASLLAQDDEFFALGRDWELIVIDDASTDNTRAIALEAATGRNGVRVLAAPELDIRPATRHMTGKTNACWFGAQQAAGKWLLFTDADTQHQPGNLVRAQHEAAKYHAAMLSYSPEQVVRGFWQRALMPLIFSELASVYPTQKVNDPTQRDAAANGQFLMVERSAYFAVGGHKVIGSSVLEDVDLARNLKRAKYGLRFRYAPDALSTRMYRDFGDMMEGWTKNLALLFPHALALAAWRLLDIALLLLPLTFYFFPYLILWQKAAILLLWARTLLRFYRRVARSNFSVLNCALSVFALPLFIVLLLRSWMQHKLLHRVTWKGRDYRTR